MNVRDLRFVDSADVYKAGVPAGRLTRGSDGTVEFAYSPGYVSAPVASTLPLDGPPIVSPAGAVPAFFAGLLPEGHRLTVLRNAVKTSMDDELTMLLAVGCDVPGDVQICPTGTTPREPSALAVSSDPAELDFDAIARQLDLVGIPGVQDKASASMLSSPLVVGTEHYILKLGPAAYPHLVVNEALHLTEARRLSIPTAGARVVTDMRGTTGLLVTRFDRTLGDDGSLHRIPLEDATQILGLPPASKYSIAAEQATLALSARTTAPLVATRNLYLQFLFAWLTGNGDLHGKNLAVLGRTMSPMYDLPCTLVYGDDSMALPISGRTTKLRARHWMDFAESIGLPSRSAATAIRIALGAAHAVDLDSLPFTGSTIAGARRELRHRRAELS